MASKSVKHHVVSVPRDLNEAAKFLAQKGEEQRATNAIQSGLNTEVEGLKAKAMADAKPHQEQLSQLVEGLFVFAEAHRDELTDGDKHKTVKVPTGTFGWRMTPPAVSLRDVPTVLDNLKSLRLERFIRTREEVNKDAMLREPDVAQRVQGVTINQHEEFIAKPTELELEIAVQVNKLKKAVA